MHAGADCFPSQAHLLTPLFVLLLAPGNQFLLHQLLHCSTAPCTSRSSTSCTNRSTAPRISHFTASRTCRFYHFSHLSLYRFSHWTPYRFSNKMGRNRKKRKELNITINRFFYNCLQTIKMVMYMVRRSLLK
ncbi:hypothetical protein BDZ91DRAFT_380971 [Kalaharituber pfeilii]|nr:hypothetical protein BDZ91DRAFT_380971 [Kalaharituber pfeilii]